MSDDLTDSERELTDLYLATLRRADAAESDMAALQGECDALRAEVAEANERTDSWEHINKANADRAEQAEAVRDRLRDAGNAALWQFNEVVSLLVEVAGERMTTAIEKEIAEQHPVMLEASRTFGAVLAQVSDEEEL